MVIAVSRRELFRPVVFLVALVMAMGAASGEPSVSSSVDRTRLRLGEDVVLTLRIERANPSLTQPHLPPLKGFKATGTYQTMEHSPKGVVLLFHYLLRPTRVGRLTLPPITFKIGHKTWTTSSLEIDVESTASSHHRRPATVSNASKVRNPSLGRDVFLEGHLSSRRTYVGQPVIYTLHLLTRRSIRGLGPVQPPDLAGFRRVDDPFATKTRSRQVRRKGLTYLDALVIRTTLFPLKAGRLPIGSFKAEINVESGPLGGSTKAVVSGGKAVLTVLPLPPAPPDFKGAVGSFTLEVVKKPPGKVQTGKPFSVTCLVRGAGFLPEDPLRPVESAFLNVYPPSEVDSSGFRNGLYTVERKIRLSFASKVSGKVVFPPVKLVYFDPVGSVYRTLSAGGAELSVEGAAAYGERAVNIAPLIKVPVPGPKPPPEIAEGLFWTLFLAPFGVSLILAFTLWVYRVVLRDEEKRRIRELKYRARKNLFRARRNLDVRKSVAFYQSLSLALGPALNLITKRTTGGMSRDRLALCLEEAGVPLTSRKLLLELIESLERERYAPALHTKQEMTVAYKAVAWWVKEACRA